ncbi:MAG: TolC family protein [Isosphaeraceae bacterium]
MNRFRGYLLATLLLPATWAWPGLPAVAQSPLTPAPVIETRPISSAPGHGESELPPALPEPFPSIPVFRDIKPGSAPMPAEPGDVHAVPLCLADAIRRSLANVQTVQANVTVRTAQVARFDALKNFVPLMSLPQFMSGFNRFTPGSAGTVIDFPSVMGFTQFAGQPGLDHLSASRLYIQLPLDPAGQILSLPVAEEGIRAKVLMEQLVRRSQAALAIQSYFEAKQILYGIRVARLAVNLAEEERQLTGRRLRQRQAYDVELSKARVAESQTRVALANLEKSSRIAQRRLATVLHQSRLLVPQDRGPMPIELDREYSFDLADPDLVDMAIIPDFPASREEAIAMAKRQRVEVRILVVGLRIAQLRNRGSVLRLFGFGWIPAELSFKDTSAKNNGVALGAIFGATYSPPLVDVSVWSRIRQAKLDVIQSQLDLEKSLIDVADDAGNSWDRWQQAVKEWQQREAELGLRREYLERRKRLYAQKQSIRIDVLGAQVDLLQADSNRWTAWYNLQLARLDMLRAMELLLDYVERAGITHLPTEPQESSPGFWKRHFAWLTRNRGGQPLTPNKETNHATSGSESALVATRGGNVDAGRGRPPAPGASSTGTDPAPLADDRLVRTGGATPTGGTAPRYERDDTDPPGLSPRRPQSGRAPAQRPSADPARRPLPRRRDPSAGESTSAGGGEDRRDHAPS